MNVEKNIIANYWLEKIKGRPIVNADAFTVASTGVVTIPAKDLSYFYKLTNGNAGAEFTLLLTAFNILAQRYFEESAVVYSKSPTELLYAFHSMGEKTFKQFLQQVKEEVQAVYKHAAYEGTLIQNQSFKSYAAHAFLYNAETDKEFPFLLSVKKQNNELALQVSFSPSFTNARVAAHFLKMYAVWITRLETYIPELCAKIPIVTEEDRHLLLNVLNDTERNRPAAQTAIGFFEAQVQRTPDHIAVIFNDVTLTYAQLNARANQLAHYLQEKFQAGAGDRVAVKLKRSEQLLIAILAVLKTGAAYVPVDVNYPAERIAYLEQDSMCKQCIDGSFNGDAYPENNLLVQRGADDLSHLIYTSGTTGKPKGVMISNSNVAEFIQWSREEFDATSFEVVYAATSHCFDLSVFEMFYTLSVGKTILLLDNPTEIAGNLQKHKGVLLNTVPSVMRGILEEGHDLSNVSFINLAGEALPVDLAAKLLRANAEVRNLYGPTEDTTYSTCYKLNDRSAKTIPIGKPVSNTQVYILDENMELLPPGVVGKLFISGAGLSKGYWNKPELTAVKFLPNPFEPGKLMYDTGDLVKWSDGIIEFYGRKDHQVKLRGYRIELEEIENAIVQHAHDIRQAVVDVRPVRNSEVLVAYYTLNGDIDEQAMRARLETTLPAYMVPAQFVKLPSFPLNVNGKVDRAALRKMQLNVPAKPFVAPRNENEQQLAEIWKEVLGVQQVSVQDHFLELGGHSLMISQIINRMYRRMGKGVSYKIFYANPTIEQLAQSLGDEQPVFEEIERATVREVYELSPSQTRYWLIYKINGRSKEFNIYSKVPLPADLNTVAFEQAFNELVQRHEALRTIFIEQDGTPKQKILDNVSVQIPVFASEAAARANVYDHEFELDVFPLIKLGLVRDAESFFLYFNMHHIISDGWSMSVIYRDLMALYNAKLSNSIAELPELSIQYKDYAQWQNRLLDSPTLREQEAYWKNALSGHLPYLQLPIDHSKKTGKPQTSHSYTVFLNEEQQQKIAGVATEHSASVFAFFTAALKILLNRLTSEEDIIIGIPAANRNHYQLKDVAGCFLNTLMLRDRLSVDMSFADVLQQVNQTLADALTNQNYPFESLLEQLNYPKDNDRFPISPVLLNLLDFEAKATERIHDFNAVHDVLPSPPKFEVECYVKSLANGYSINCVYDGGLFKQETIEYWLNELLAVLNQATENAAQQVKELKMFQALLPAQVDAMPSNAFAHFEDEEIHQGISQRFEKIAGRFPDRTAVYAENKWLTYRQLNNAANHLAQAIRENKTASTKRIALLLDHDDTCVTGMLGVLKSGHAYVPIDINNPVSRIGYILKDSGSATIICSNKTLETAQQLKAVMPELAVIDLSTIDTTAPVNDPGISIDPLSEAYVLYTSGSTGEPKGVVQIQRNVLHYIRVYTNNVRIHRNDNLSVFSTYTFDASVKDIYGAILNGATVSFYDIREHGINALAGWLRLHGISIIHMVPTIYRHFLKGLPAKEIIETVRLVDLGGEPCFKTDLELFKEHFVKGAFVVNDYGPTESTIVSQKFLSHDAVITRTSLPMGQPVTETEIFLLNESLNRLGIYQEGEIAFSSSYLSLGYLNRPELTNRAFITDPANPAKRIYRSGDIGRMLPDGEIEFVRRRDTQVKLNGLRIELSEIECHLGKIDGLKEAVVMLRENNGNNILAAYIRKEPSLETAHITDMLRLSLPKNMIPSVFIPMESFPLTRTGKIDRKALPQPALNDLKTLPYAASQTAAERALAGIWAEVLKLNANQVGARDNFFELGGNSLLAVKLANKIQQHFGVNLRVREVFDNPNIEKLSQLVAANENTSQLHIPALAEATDYMLSPNQRRLWITCQQSESGTAYNLPGALFLQGELDIKALKDAYALLLSRHESLRTVLVNNGDALPRQKILSTADPVFDIEQSTAEPSTELLGKLVNEESNIPFELNDQELTRVKIFEFGGNRFLLVAVMHHIISDGWSMEIFIKEWIALYAGLKNGTVPQLRPLSIQYKDFSAWQQQFITSPAFNTLIDYWKQRLSGELPVLNLPVSKNKTTTQASAGEIIDFSVNDELYAALNKLAVINQTSLYSVLFTAFNVLLHHVGKPQQIILGTSVAGRRHEALEHVIGFFVNTLAIRTTVNAQESFTELLRKTAGNLLNDFEHQDMPFDELLKHLNYNRTPGVTPLFQARFVLNDLREDAFSGLDAMGIRISPVKAREVRPKFNLSLVMHYGKHLSGAVEYKTALLEKEVVQLVITAYVQLLGKIIEQPGATVSGLDTFNHAYQEHLNKSKAAIKDSFLKNLQTLQKR